MIIDNGIGSTTTETDQSVIQWEAPTIRPATTAVATSSAARKVARPAGAISSVLDAIAPLTVDASGKTTIWGLSPALAYFVGATILIGGGVVAWQKLGGRKGRRVAPNPRRRRRGRGRRSRRKT